MDHLVTTLKDQRSQLNVPKSYNAQNNVEKDDSFYRKLPVIPRVVSDVYHSLTGIDVITPPKQVTDQLLPRRT